MGVVLCGCIICSMWRLKGSAVSRCAHQAFQYGRSVIGLQFHLETTPESAKALVAHCRDELVASRYVQSEEEILAAEAGRFQVIHRLLGDILTYLGQTAVMKDG